MERTGNMRVVIATALDNDYTMPTVVMLESLLENAGCGTIYDIHVMAPDDFSKGNRERMERLMEIHRGHHMAFINMGKTFSDVKMQNPHISFPTYYRLLLPDILQKEDRCIYLDGDTLVLQDLGQLYREDLGEAYIAGVRAPTYQKDAASKEIVCRRLGIEKAEGYINAGVLLLNLKKMRENHMVGQFLELLQTKKWRTQDQDILNAACYGRIKHIPFCYNYQVVGSCYPQELLEQIFPQEERIGERQMPVIVHYSHSAVKPWKSMQYCYSDFWWDYFRRTSYAKEEEERKQEIKKKEEQYLSEFERKKELLRGAPGVVLFGYSATAKELLGYLERDEIDVQCFCDNDEKKQGVVENGRRVLSAEQCYAEYPSLYYINTSQLHRNEITEQLLSFGIPRKRIFEYQKEVPYLECARKPEYKSRFDRIYLLDSKE